MTTIWLTGLPSSGKTTLARELTARQSARRAVEHLDGDVLRREMFPELGFSRDDRMENIRRIGDLAVLLARHDVLVVVSVIAPYQQARDAVRAAHRAQGLHFVEVHVHAPQTVCAARDVKGLYARAASGALSGLTGAGDVYEVPSAPDVQVRTAERGVEECVLTIEQALAATERRGKEALV
ncbi:adenylyl-sulfate kinase [Streptomyces sp. NRRL B-1347]|uniref:adenylyl-sulfate kinase n=1 Tax=Streptomyces sp. NRRL B-1347 TaxID=1476877 RepID=UPI00068C4500|nr:adenylyl-sulfate kinase [Streptomyces sp. NRRL B-1347]